MADVQPPPPGSPGRAGLDPTAPRPPKTRRRLKVALAVIALALVADLARPGPDQLTARAMVGVIGVYQASLSKAMPTMGIHCRFEPTCSHYGKAVIARDGALVGTAKAAWRIARCGPWTAKGTHDPP